MRKSVPGVSVGCVQPIELWDERGAPTHPMSHSPDYARRAGEDCRRPLLYWNKTGKLSGDLGTGCRRAVEQVPSQGHGPTAGTGNSEIRHNYDNRGAFRV